MQFFTKKNPTPRDLALYSALVVTGVFFIIEIIVVLISNDYGRASVLGLLQTIIVFGATFMVFQFALTRFIYRRIKIVYKTIHHLKRAKGDPMMTIDLRNHIIDEVEKEVINWSKKQNKEIESLKEMEEYRKNLLGNISHELKTPIFNIQGYLYTLQDGAMEDPKIAERYLSRAISNVERLGTIVADLEQISQLEAGELTLDFQKFDIQFLTKEVFEDLEIKAAEKSIKLNFKEGSQKPFQVYGDRERIRQVLINFVNNSIKYGKKGGTTRVGFYDMGNEILTEVTDDGIGIDEKHLPRLFERFYRVDKGRSRDMGGSGLGLSIVKHIIEAHKQNVNVRSRVGVGSTFGFTLSKPKKT